MDIWDYIAPDKLLGSELYEWFSMSKPRLANHPTLGKAAHLTVIRGEWNKPEARNFPAACSSRH
jgi:hypothetical protein